MVLVLLVLGAYLLGSIPFPFASTSLVPQKDIRYAGNGNVGTRNTMRVAGRTGGLIALLLDALRGAATYWLADAIGATPNVVYLASGVMKLGHWFPIWLGFRGGIGQGAASGFAVAMWPLPGLIGVITFLITLPIAPLCNIAYAIAAIFAIAGSIWQGYPWQDVTCCLGLMIATVLKKRYDTPCQQRLLAAMATRPQAK